MRHQTSYWCDNYWVHESSRLLRSYAMSVGVSPSSLSSSTKSPIFLDCSTPNLEATHTAVTPTNIHQLIWRSHPTRFESSRTPAVRTPKTFKLTNCKEKKKEHEDFATEPRGLISHCTNLSTVLLLFCVYNLLPKNRTRIQNIERSQLSVLFNCVVKVSLRTSYNTVWKTTVINSG